MSKAFDHLWLVVRCALFATAADAQTIATVAGVTFTATQPTSPVPDRWLSRPLVYEGRSAVAPCPR